MKVTTKDGIQAGCEECGFYKDCPYDYLCPPAEIVKFLQDEQKAGRVRILFRKDLIKEIEE